MVHIFVCIIYLLSFKKNCSAQIRIEKSSWPPQRLLLNAKTAEDAPLACEEEVWRHRQSTVDTEFSSNQSNNTFARYPRAKEWLPSAKFFAPPTTLANRPATLQVHAVQHVDLKPQKASVVRACEPEPVIPMHINTYKRTHNTQTHKQTCSWSHPKQRCDGSYIWVNIMLNSGLEFNFDEFKLFNFRQM